MIDAADEAAVARAREHVARAVAELAAASARTEVLAEFVPERRVLGLPRAARMTAADRVWRLGALLLDAHLVACTRRAGSCAPSGPLAGASRPRRSPSSAPTAPPP